MPPLCPWTSLSASQHLPFSQSFLLQFPPSMSLLMQPLGGDSMLTWLMDILEQPCPCLLLVQSCQFWKCQSGPGCHGEMGTLALILSQWCPLSRGPWSSSLSVWSSPSSWGFNTWPSFPSFPQSPSLHLRHRSKHKRTEYRSQFTLGYVSEHLS